MEKLACPARRRSQNCGEDHARGLGRAVEDVQDLDQAVEDVRGLDRAVDAAQDLASVEDEADRVRAANPSLTNRRDHTRTDHLRRARDLPAVVTAINEDRTRFELIKTIL